MVGNALAENLPYKCWPVQDPLHPDEEVWVVEHQRYLKALKEIERLEADGR